MNLRNTYRKPIRNFYMMTFSLIVFLNVWVGCHNPPDPIAKVVTSENALLDSTFRIDIKTITVTYNIYPGDFQVEGTAVLTFQMRNGQTKPIVHFDPAISDKSIINSISLNGEALDVSNTSDVSVKGFTETPQSGLEFQRELGGGIHTLEMSYTLVLPDDEEWIYSDVNDIIGNGNEEWFPTLNTPHELARHRLTFRVHSENEYHFIGSGLVVQTDNGAGTTAGLTGLTAGLAGGNVQEWTLDTEREIASYTVMFMAMPADLVDYEEATVEGVDLRIMAYKDISYDSGIGAVKYALINWLAELKRELGPFPMERGLSIFVTGVDGGGMEYFGATQTSVEALMHEVLHMYFGCSTVNKTYRDTWLDEAIVEWYDISKVPDVVPIDDTYRSDIVSGRTPTSIGFDVRAYQDGTGIMLAVSTELGGREQMMGFLRYLHENYSYAPFNTFDFLQYLRDYSGIDMEDKFLNWLYDGRRDYSPASVTSGSLSTNSPPLPHQRKKPNLKPSLKLLKKTGYK